MRIALAAWLILSLCTVLYAGIRAPGKYSGVVFFDRWDTCVIVSGPYLMYISEDLKAGFRSYAGRAVEVDATDVMQPINPGDGLIRKYNWIGLAPEPHRSITLDGLELSAEGDPGNDQSVSIEIRNRGDRSVTIRTDEVGIHVFGVQSKSSMSPSNGASEAVITRAHLTRDSGVWESSDGKTTRHAGYKAERDIPPTFTLGPGRSFRVKLTFDLSPGEYQFVFSYGGGVHEEASLLSNGVSMTVSKTAASKDAGETRRAK